MGHIPGTCFNGPFYDEERMLCRKRVGMMVKYKYWFYLE